MSAGRLDRFGWEGAKIGEVGRRRGAARLKAGAGAARLRSLVLSRGQLGVGRLVLLRVGVNLGGGGGWRSRSHTAGDLHATQRHEVLDGFPKDGKSLTGVGQSGATAGSGETGLPWTKWSDLPRLWSSTAKFG